MMGGKAAHEFMYLTPIGEDTLILCDACGYRPIGKLRALSSHPRRRRCAAVDKVATPDTKTIDALRRC